MRSMLLPLVSLLFHAWIAWRLVPDLGTPWSYMLLALVVLSASTAPLGLGMRRAVGRGPLLRAASRVGLIAIGFFSSLLVLTLLRDVGLLLFEALRQIGLAGTDTGEPGAVARVSAQVVAAVAVLVTAWG